MQRSERSTSSLERMSLLEYIEKFRYEQPPYMKNIIEFYENIRPGNKVSIKNRSRGTLLDWIIIDEPQGIDGP